MRVSSEHSRDSDHTRAHLNLPIITSRTVLSTPTNSHSLCDAFGGGDAGGGAGADRLQDFLKNPSLSLDPAPFAMQHSPPEASSSFCSAQTSRQGPLRPTLGANPFPEVTDPVVCGWHSMVLVPVMVLKVCAAGHGCHGAAAPSAAAHDPRLQGKTPASRMPSNPLVATYFC